MSILDIILGAVITALTVGAAAVGGPLAWIGAWAVVVAVMAICNHKSKRRTNND